MEHHPSTSDSFKEQGSITPAQAPVNRSSDENELGDEQALLTNRFSEKPLLKHNVLQKERNPPELNAEITCRGSPGKFLPGEATLKDAKRDAEDDALDDDDDNASVSTNASAKALDTELQDLKYFDLLRKSLPSRYEEKGKRRSKFVAVYVNTLEERVAWLEKRVKLLVGSEEKPESSSKRQLAPPCIQEKQLKINRMDAKKWKPRNSLGQANKRGEHVIDVSYSGYASVHRNFPGSSEKGEIIMNHEAPALEDDIATPPEVKTAWKKTSNSAVVPARVAFSSPWPSILLEMVTGLSIPEKATLVYPFKHIVTFESQIKKFVELLDTSDNTVVTFETLEAYLVGIFKDIVQANTSTKYIHTNSDPDITKILAGKDMSGHVKKKKMRSGPKTASAAEISKDVKSQKVVASIEKRDEVDDENKTSMTKIISGKKPKDADASLDKLACTCLQDARNHLRLLVQFIDEDLSELITMRKNIANGNLEKIAFEYLWHLYRPGDVVISSQSDSQVYRVLHVSGGRPLMNMDTKESTNSNTQTQSKCSPFVIDCLHLDFDGEKFGPVRRKFTIDEYDEEKSIKRLDIYPLRFAIDKIDLENELVQRGRRFVELAGIKHMTYSGLTLGELQEEVDSEVMIDFEMAFRQSGEIDWKPELGIFGPSVANPMELFEANCSDSECRIMACNDICDDTKLDRKLMNDFLFTEALDLFKEGPLENYTFSRNQLLLLPSRVYGFVLRSRKWVCLDINLVQDVEYDTSTSKQTEAFDDLVIPPQYKQVVMALVANHSRGSTPIDSDASASRQIDLIRGKGKGLIILLHGVPGVGKTSTAESVAAYTKRPLLPITCGDIGQTPEIVEERLEALFLLARKWGCVLLLDEADVFLAKRERGSDITRNALVSVFLRTLEYYTGILFLTTNRVGSFDEAFKSRIHMSLYYPELDKESTLKIWEMNLSRINRGGRNIQFKKDKIIEFAKHHWEDSSRWNGRQIRNAFQTAIALAEYDYHAECKECKSFGKPEPHQPVLKKKHFQSVAKASAEFDNYLAGVLGEDSYSLKAKQGEIRNDSWRDRGVETSYGKTYTNQPPITRPANRSVPTPFTPSSIPRSMPTAHSAKGNEDKGKAARIEELKKLKMEKERMKREEAEREQKEKEKEESELAELEKWLEEEETQKGSMASNYNDDDDDDDDDDEGTYGPSGPGQSLFD